jgi:hypothetical protein
VIFLRTRAGIGIGILTLCAAATPAAAQRLELSVDPNAIVIQAGDPDAMPVASSTPVSVNYRVRQNNEQTWLLTVQANGDLDTGGSTIDISAVSWTATPAPPFRNGTLSKAVVQTVATGVGSVPSPSTGTIIFRLTNSWSYDAGIYTQVLVFTLSTP